MSAVMDKIKPEPRAQPGPLWAELVEAALWSRSFNEDGPTPFADWCLATADELCRRFDFEPPAGHWVEI